MLTASITVSAAPTRVFISYAWKDCAQLAHRLYDELKKAACAPWKDNERMRGGATWRSEIATEIDATDVVVALVSPGSIASEVCGCERVRALRKKKLVIPVIAVRDTDFPLELEGKIFRDLSGAKPYRKELKALLDDIRLRQNGVSLPERLKTTYVTAPPLPPNYIERADVVTMLRKALIVDATDEVPASIAITALQGMGGIGKTVLAQSLAHDEAVQQAFPDGVLWVTVGKEPAYDLITRLREVGKALGDDLTGYDTELGSVNRYRNTMRDKAAMIILDDVWNTQDLEPFRAESPRSRLLFTTRDAGIASSAGANLISQGFLTPDESREMLATWAQLPAGGMPSNADDIIRECGSLPLALATIGAILRGKPRAYWQLVHNALRKADLAKLRHKFPDYSYPTVLRALQISVEALEPTLRERYAALAVIVEDMPVHPVVQRVLWNTDEFDALETAEEFVRLALAQRAEPEGSIRLHDLLLDYVRAEYSNRNALDVILATTRLSSHIIERDPSQYASQLVGRLLPYVDTPMIRDFSNAVAKAAPRPFLRLRFPTLQVPGTGLLRTLEGHTGHITSVAVTSDGQRAVSGSGDGTLKVWDLRSGRNLQTLDGRSWINAVALMPDGRHAISGSGDGTLKIWDLERGQLLQTLRGHAGSVKAVAVTLDGRRAVSGSADHTVKVWDLESGNELQTLSGHAYMVKAVVLTPDSRRAVSASADTTLKVWELESGRELQTLSGHTSAVTAVIVTPDGRRAVSASVDKTLKVWDLESGLVLQTLGGHTLSVEAVAATPNGRHVVSGSYDETINVWDLESGHVLQTLEPHDGWVKAVVVTMDGQCIVSGSTDGTIKVCGLANNCALQGLEARGGTVTIGARAVMQSASDHKMRNDWAVHKLRNDSVVALAITPDDRRVVSISDHTIKVWDLASGRVLERLGSLGFGTALAITPDGRRAVVASKRFGPRSQSEYYSSVQFD